MATAKRTETLRLWEVTTRTELGREIVHRVSAASGEDAVAALRERPGIDVDLVVDVREAGT